MDDRTFLDGRLIVKVGDITEEDCDGIVNAANSTLLGGGGVDGAIHRKGGPAILDECRRIRETKYPDGLPTGQAVITTGGNLAARFVIHTVGPIYGENDGHDAELLADCYRSSIRLAAANRLFSIAFPSISTGAFGYPKQLAAPVVAAAIAGELLPNNLDLNIRLVFFSEPDAAVFLDHAGF